MRVGGGIDRVLRSLGDVDAAFDVDGAAAIALELTLETQARGDSDALLQQRFVVSELRKPGASFESTQDLIARIVEVLLVELVDSCAMSTAGTPVEDDSPFAHELDPEVVEIARPLVQRVAESLPCQVRVPLRGVRERIGVQGREDPAVATTRLRPADHALVGCVLVEREPADEHGRVAIIGEMRGCGEQHALRHPVLGELAVAIHPPRLGRDDVWGVAGDEPEGLALHGLEQASLTALDIVEPVQGGVERRVRERSRIDVRRDDLPGMLCGKQRVDAAAGADGERSCDARAWGERIENPSGRGVGRDVVGRIVCVP